MCLFVQERVTPSAHAHHTILMGQQSNESGLMWSYLILNLLLTSLLCLMCCRLRGLKFLWRNHTAEEAERIFIRKTERNRPKIELRLMVAEAKQGQRTARAMWEESEGVLQFTRIKSKHFVYWQTLNAPRPSSRAFPQGEPLLWTPAPLASAGSPTSVPGAVWASHKSGFCPHRTHRLPLNKKNEILLSHSSVWWLSCLVLNWSTVKFRLASSPATSYL